MKAILNIAVGFFDFLPFQRPCNFIGAVLVIAGCALTLMAANPKAAISMTGFLGLPGIFLIVLAPSAFGGLALRYASAHNATHLRPHGRARMLLGAALAITLFALVASLPTLALHHVYVKAGGAHRLTALAQPAGWFLSAWGFIAVAWIIMFAMSSSRMLMLMMGPLPLVLVVAGSALNLPAPDPQTIFIAVAAACAVFATWYMRTSRIKRPDWIANRLPLNFGNFRIRPLERLFSSHDDSRTGAQRQYLLGPVSSAAYILAGTVPALILIAMTTMLLRDKVPLNPASCFLILTIAPASLAYMIARRARSLWLKVGLPRDALFRLAERTGLRTSLLVVGIGSGILLLAGTLVRPLPASILLLDLLAVIVLSIGVFYFGLSLTKGWNAASVILGIGITMFVGVTGSFIDPAHNPSTSTLWKAAGLFALLAPFLRWHASRRWQTLDWRVARLPRMGRQAA